MEWRVKGGQHGVSRHFVFCDLVELLLYLGGEVVVDNLLKVVAQEVSDQLAGRRLFFDILRDTIRQVRSEGGASSIYFVYDSNIPNGVNRASGDTIKVAFDAGQASRIKINGNRTRNEGEYFPEQMVKGQETIFRLQGFRWIGRNGGVGALSGTLPKAPAVPDVQPVTPEGEVTTPSRRLR